MLLRRRLRFAGSSLSCRADFPRALNETYFNSAAQHPLGNHTVRGMQRYIEFLSKGPGEGREDFWETGFLQVKPMFAKLINAKPSEIALCGSTTIGENTLLERARFARRECRDERSALYGVAVELSAATGSGTRRSRDQTPGLAHRSG